MGGGGADNCNTGASAGVPAVRFNPGRRQERDQPSSPVLHVGHATAILRGMGNARGPKPEFYQHSLHGLLRCQQSCTGGKQLAGTRSTKQAQAQMYNLDSDTNVRVVNVPCPLCIFLLLTKTIRRGDMVAVCHRV